MTDGLAPMEVPSGINCPSRTMPPGETLRGRMTGMGGKSRADSQTQDVKYGILWICTKLAMESLRLPRDLRVPISSITLVCMEGLQIMFSMVAQIRAEVVSGAATINSRMSALRSSSLISADCID